MSGRTRRIPGTPERTRSGPPPACLRELVAAWRKAAPEQRDGVDDGMQVNHDFAADQVDVVAALAAQHPCHRRERAGVDLLAVVLVGADVAVLAERAAHVAGGEEDRAGSLGAAVKQLLAGVMEMGADPRAGGELAGSELDARAAVDATIPGTEIAMREHPVRELAAKLQHARPVRRFGQGRARANGLPSRQEARA